jgi:alkylated DNA repair dioxygenase AlkB
MGYGPEAKKSNPGEILQIGINEYRPGTGIGWHKDKPEFGDVVGISLLSDVRMRFRKRSGNGWVRAFQLLEARSVYVLSGEVKCARSGNTVSPRFPPKDTRLRSGRSPQER